MVYGSEYNIQLNGKGEAYILRLGRDFDKFSSARETKNLFSQ